MSKKQGTIKFCSCSSGSSGNSYVVATERAAILLDAGTTGKNMVAGLAKCGLTPADLDAIFLTHEHHDHIRGLGVILREIGKKKSQPYDNSHGSELREIKVYGSGGTIAATEARLFPKSEFSQAAIINSPLDRIQIGDIWITAFRLSHDAAEPMGFRIDAYGKSLALVTDTGYVTDSIYRNILDVDFLVMEANHEKNILLMGRYPYDLKTRILGDYGHLSNEAAGESLARILGERNKPLRIALAHLSRENNTPDMAKITVTNILFENDFMENRDYEMVVLERDSVGDVFEI